MNFIASTIPLIQLALIQYNVAKTGEEERARCHALEVLAILTKVETSKFFQCEALLDEIIDSNYPYSINFKIEPPQLEGDYRVFLYQAILWTYVALSCLATVPDALLDFKLEEELGQLIITANLLCPTYSASSSVEKPLNYGAGNFQWLWQRALKETGIKGESSLEEIYKETSWHLFKASRIIASDNTTIIQLCTILVKQLEYFDPIAFKERYPVVEASLVLANRPEAPMWTEKQLVAAAWGSLLPDDYSAPKSSMVRSASSPVKGSLRQPVPARPASLPAGPPNSVQPGSASLTLSFGLSLNETRRLAAPTSTALPPMGMLLPPPPNVRSQAASPLTVRSPLRRSKSMPSMHLTSVEILRNEDANRIISAHQITKVCTDPIKQQQHEIKNCVDKFLQRLNNCAKTSIDAQFMSSRTNTRLSEQELEQLGGLMAAEDKRIREDFNSYNTYCDMLSGVKFNTVFFKNYIDQFMRQNSSYNPLLAQAQKVFYYSTNYILVLEQTVVKKISVVTPTPISFENLPPYVARAMVIFKYHMELLSNVIARKLLNVGANQLEIESLTQQLENLQKNYKLILTTHSKSIEFDLKRSLVKSAPQAQSSPGPILKAVYMDSAVIEARTAYLNALGELGEIASQLTPQSVPASPLALASASAESRPASRESSVKRQLFAFEPNQSRPSSAQSSDQTRGQQPGSQLLPATRAASSVSLASMPLSPAKPVPKNDFSRMRESQQKRFEREFQLLYPSNPTGEF